MKINNNFDQISKEKGNTYAVLVGISDYKYINSLQYCDDDVKDIESALKNSKNWKDAKITELLNEKATKKNINKAIEKYSGKLGPEDKFIFYYSGHGTNSWGKARLCPYNTSIFGTGLISESDLKERFVSLAKDPNNPPQIGVMIDSCFSGGMIDGKADTNGKRSKFVEFKNSERNFKNSAKELSKVKNSVILTASSASEVSYETDELKNGVFAYFLTEGFCLGENMGPADENMDNKISLEEAFNYTQSRVTNYKPLKNKQHPQLCDNYAGEYIIKE